jgi:hypothetical protein
MATVSGQSLAGSKWIYKVADSCIDTIKFNSNNKLDDYSCELNYTFKGYYSVKEGVVTLIEKDNSHDEDGGKVTFYRLKFKLEGDYLYPISNEEMTNGRWKKMSKSLIENTVFQRVNNAKR